MSFFGCCNKLPQIQWLKTTQIYHLKAFQKPKISFNGLKSRHGQTHILSGASKGNLQGPL
jgi:hypothetical protein